MELITPTGQLAWMEADRLSPRTNAGIADDDEPLETNAVVAQAGGCAREHCCRPCAASSDAASTSSANRGGIVTDGVGHGVIGHPMRAAQSDTPEFLKDRTAGIEPRVVVETNPWSHRVDVAAPAIENGLGAEGSFQPVNLQLQNRVGKKLVGPLIPSLRVRHAPQIGWDLARPGLCHGNVSAEDAATARLGDGWRRVE